jgi:hypothetical protein
LEYLVIMFHPAVVIIAAVFLVTSIKRQASPWLVFFVGLIVHAGPSLLLLGTYPGGIGYIVAFFAVPVAGSWSYFMDHCCNVYCSAGQPRAEASSSTIDTECLPMALSGQADSH